MSTRRIHYIDWLRVLAVLLLFPFHTGRVYNAGELFYAKSSIVSMTVSRIIWFVDPWHMPLLFLLAGASTYFAMKRRSTGKFMGERSLRLLVPLIFGVLVLVPPQTWYGARTNDGYAGSYIDYFTSGRAFDAGNLFGRGDYYGGITPAHLWFIMFLWMLCVLALPLLAWGRTEGGRTRLTRAARALGNPLSWLLVVFLVLIGDALPEMGVSNPLYYFVFFVVGYIAMHDDAFTSTAERLRWPSLIAGFTIIVLSMVFWRIGDSMPDPSPQLALWSYGELAGGWLSLVGILGLGKHHLDHTSPTLQYLAEASYPVYILHQTVIVVIGFYLVEAIASPAIGWPVLMVLAVAITYALYELVRRAGPLRFLFGMRPLQREAA